MKDIHACIEEMGRIIENMSIEETKKKAFREQYDVILSRSKDKKLYLSTIGDFSSGKSTLINQIINRRLLKVAHAATTAVPNYIYKGEKDQLSVWVKCENGKEYELTDAKGAKAFEADFHLRLPEAIDERISLLTADQELSLRIQKVDIQLPDDELAGDICIIDTPGINPGADFAQKHADITKYILSEKADAAIILFPADQAYTQSFEKFLMENAEYFMKDAIFVVTMMDRVDEEERADVIQFVKANLKTSFHLENPKVLSCSAMKAAKDPYWAKNFEEFENALIQRLSENRQRIITERLIKLSNELLISIQSEIQIRKDEFEKRLEVLKQHSVPQLTSVLSYRKQAALDEIHAIREKHDKAIKAEQEDLPTKIMAKVNASLNACDTRSGVTRYVDHSLASDIESACADIYSVSETHTFDLSEALSEAVCEMIEMLKTYYGEIGSVLPESKSLETSENRIEITDKLNGLGVMISDFEGKIDLATALGGAGLAALILTGLGPIGWIVGGFAALIGGDRLFVESSRGKVRDAVRGKLGSIYKSVSDALLKSMKNNFESAEVSLDEKCSELINEYQPVYEKLEREFTLEEEQLTQKIKESGNIQTSIKEILMRINQIKGEIAG